MALPERDLVEQHVIQHAVERRFVCDICHAALKRKDHLTRHKLSHIPDRPHACNVSFIDRQVSLRTLIGLLCPLFLDLHEDVQAQGAVDSSLRHSLG
jgi:hypothetical protein